MGPFEVLPHISTPSSDGTFNVYRLRHLGSGEETTANVRQMLPYISRAAHDAQTTTTPTPSAVPTAVFVPEAGSYVLLPNEGGVPFQLLKITDVDGHVLTAQYLNTTDKHRRRRFRLCWQHDSELEMQPNTQPQQPGYTPWLDTFARADFCQRSVVPTKIGQSASGSWFNLPKSEIDATLACPPL